MNQNDILAQQQALLNQAMQNSQHVVWGAIAIQVILFIIGAVVIYLFYARLRDMAHEVRKLRIAYEAAHPPNFGTRSPVPAAPHLLRGITRATCQRSEI